jgi:catechol 2,3-dioxygenase-like lactoylglutathione lyase family enzyme
MRLCGTEEAGALLQLPEKRRASFLMNVKQAVPFFKVSDMTASIRFYVDGLGCEIRDRWAPDGQLRWCWLTLGEAALMLQQFPTSGHDSWTPTGKVGEGVTTVFICEDALQFYRQVKSQGIEASQPFVSNGMWLTSLTDPDGYRLDFESDTDVPEGTRLEEERR